MTVITIVNTLSLFFDIEDHLDTQIGKGYQRDENNEGSENYYRPYHIAVQHYGEQRVYVCHFRFNC